MNLLGKILNYFNQRKTLKLERSREEKLELFKNTIEREIIEIIENEQFNKEEVYEKIYNLFKTNIIDFQILNNDDRLDIETFVKSFIHIEEVKETINFIKQKEEEKEFSYKFIFGKITYENIQQLIEKYYKDKNNIKFLSNKEIYQIIDNILKKYRPYESEIIKMKLDGIFELLFYNKITEEKNPREVLRIYNEYLQDFLKGDSEQEENFRKSISIRSGEDFPKKDLLRKIDFLKNLKDFDFLSIDNVPLYYDTQIDKPDEKTNASIAREKISKDISAEDLVFVRLTSLFPTDGIVEHIGGYSEPEYMTSPFNMELLKKYPDVDSNEVDILIPRFRWTIHWTINGVVGDHAYGNFSNRDYAIIEDVSQRKGDKKIIGVKEEDTMIVGDIKLSKKARIVMSVEKYQELISNPKMKKQLKDMNVVVFNGSQAECIKSYMNDMGYVWGNISSHSYIIHDNPYMDYEQTDEAITGMYLTKIQEALENGEVEGLNHCHYAGEGFTLEDINPNCGILRSTLTEIAECTMRVIGYKECTKFDNISIQGFNRLMDDYFSIRSILQYIDFLDEKFPEMQILEKMKGPIERYYKGGPCGNVDTIIEDFISKVNIEELKEATKEYNEMVRKEVNKVRKEKDKKLFDEGKITAEQYGERIGETNDSDDLIK